MAIAHLASPVTTARAAAFYVESGGGVSKIQGGESFFGTGTPATTDFGGAFNMGIFYGFADGRDPIDFQLGLQGRWNSAPSGLLNYSTLGAYPIIRLQVTRLFFAVGASPYMWKRVANSAGIDGYESVSSVISYYGEAGLLWPITRDFSLGTSASGQFVSSGGTLSPKPILELGVLMRFYFGHSGASSSASTGSNEWQGWRYPFGYLRK